MEPHVDPAERDERGEREVGGAASVPSASIVAAMNAVVAWPDGNELVIGRRIP